MKSFYDVQQFLKKYGTIIYTGNRLADLELMESEIKELFDINLIETKEYQIILLILRHEIHLERAKKK